MTNCERVDEITRGHDGSPEHLRDCVDCRDARIVHGFFRVLAGADDLAPSLPDPKVLLLKAEFMRRQAALRLDADGARWTSVGVWSSIAIAWLVVLTWKLGEIQSLLERFDFVRALPGGTLATAVLVAVLGGLLAFTVFAVAVHSVLAEM